MIVDTKDLLKDAYLKTFEAIGREALPIDTLHQLPGTSLRDYFPHIFGDQAGKAQDIFYAYINQNHLLKLKTTQGASEVLDFIYSLSIPMAVISNKRGDILRKEIKHLGFEKFFFSVVGSKDCSEDKPSRVPVQFILQQKNISIPNDHVWLIGDWKADLECAHNAGITPVLINNPSLKNIKFNPFPPKIYLESCLDLKNFLIQCMRKDDETK